MKKFLPLTASIMRGLFVILLLLVGGYGFFVGKYQIFPYRLFHSLTTTSDSAKQIPYEPNDEIFQYAFKKKKIDFQVYPAVNTLEKLTNRLDGMYFPVEEFFSAYDHLRLSGAERSQDVFRVDYQLADRHFSAFSYRRDAVAPKATGCAVLVIPGSGSNQSTPIFQKDTTNYHGDILEIFEPQCDSFVLVKPNEDFLAIHNGKGKLDYDFILRYLLNKGGSYSANYLVDSLAFTKYLKEHYPKIYVVGLSQGGEAALLNALQSHPTATVVASGFSLLSDRIDWADFKQIIVPGLRQYYSNDRIFDVIKNSNTRFLFTYGKKEIGPYRIEAEEGLVCNRFGALKNVECAIHPAGHAFDKELVRKFINQ